ncbi:IclR family transcriptional regulator [Paucibacter sp. R3-3]|uniref:IclR family transcriptional regulator n=1 Tax=Roseateles agri TaxID=3098619 RepID=A0ABU5DP18_9BURK|nr:IclR family transcriptional regulator [Paucibacter sp. R3-3]MDY0748058.1 IclR family transcriptional regulator [Paucibacter sp. R3-3]
MKPSTSSGETLGAVQKACRVLAELSGPGPHRLSNIVANTGLNKATALRLLDALGEEGFVQRYPVDKTYALGNGAFAMHASVSRRVSLPASAHTSLMRVAEVTGDTTCLSVPCGSHSVCIDREEGSNPWRVNYLQVGRRLPLGVGSAGMALIAWLPDEEVEQMIARNRVVLAARFPRVGPERIRREVQLSRERGYSLSASVVTEGTGGLSVPILDMQGRPVAAIGASALVERLVKREVMLAELLIDEASRIESALHGRDGTDRAAHCSTAAQTTSMREISDVHA